MPAGAISTNKNGCGGLPARACDVKSVSEASRSAPSLTLQNPFRYVPLRGQRMHVGEGL